MIATSQAYRAAVTAPTRHVRVRTPLRLASPEASYGAPAATSQAPVSRPEELLDDVWDHGPRYASLEEGLWPLDGTAALLTGSSGAPGQAGFVSGEVCGADGVFASPQTLTLPLSGVSTLQAMTLTFPGGEWGVPADFVLKVFQGGAVRFTEDVSDNAGTRYLAGGFTVYAPDAVSITVTRWSMGNRRMRIMEWFPGYAADWDGDQITELEIRMQAAPDNLTLPYGTADITFDNSDRRFDPRNKSGLFQSLEEGQPVPVELGVDLPDGSTEYVPCGVWYRQGRSWSARDSDLTLRWALTDMVGLLTDRDFTVPASLPTTLSGWVAELAAQLGGAFSGKYAVDGDYAGLAVTARAADLSGKSCGDILRWICMATNTFPRADPRNGYLTVEPLWEEGGELTLPNLTARPVLSANDDYADLRFQTRSGECEISGSTDAASASVTVDNPFLAGETEALAAARGILASCGGNRISATGRGDPSSEIGDVMTVELDGSSAVTGRLIKQVLRFSGGVLSGCQAELLQADGALRFTGREVLTESGAWTAPEGVTELYVILVGGGQGGGHGTSGSNPWTKKEGWNYGSNGSAGKSGSGGNIWYGTISVNEGQSFAVTIGAGGAPGTSTAPTDGSPTTFGSYSSANGRVYDPSYTDLASGSAFGRSGVASPAAHTGDGGKGGSGGTRGAVCYVDLGSSLAGTTNLVAAESYSATAGSYGVAGASGCVILYYDKEEST